MRGAPGSRSASSSRVSASSTGSTSPTIAGPGAYRRAKKDKPPVPASGFQIPSRQIVPYIALVVTVLFIFLNLFSRPRYEPAAAENTRVTSLRAESRSLVESAGLSSDFEQQKQHVAGDGRRGVRKRSEVGSVPAGEVAEGAEPWDGHLTDHYFPVREGEILAKWHPRMGLAIDTWDPRTHDPTELDSQRYGDLIEIRPAEKKFYLSVLVYNRMDENGNKGIGITHYELRQWLEYLRYAGVAHVYWYDAARPAEESQERALKPYVYKGFLTYNNFHSLFPGNLDKGSHFERDKSYVHGLATYGGTTEWMAVLDDVDYPFMIFDTNPGFLQRHLRVYEADYPDVSQMLMQTILFRGDPEADRPALLIERYERRDQDTLGVGLMKELQMRAIIRPPQVQRVYRGKAQHFEMLTGKTVAMAARTLRNNRYIGNFGGGIMRTLTRDPTMEPIIQELRKILKVPVSKSRKSLIQGA
eukprot:TRINITY_DN3647_c0_g1_i1.p1 TRINITY_DN3647_c0_g1~~TRINITY_DN3647_c0_g1_i1.p1  ORF type:complete len:471 (+),score=87.11 TRINITY_DN3647_c0_g1_i1:215-1627(+)